MRTQVLVLAAGLGSRFGGVKQVEGVGPRGETVLEYSVYDAVAAGFDEVVFLIRAGIEADFRQSVLSRLPPWVKYRVVFQEVDSLLGPADAAAAAAAGRRKPWGTGHALLCAAPLLDSPFAVINADDSYGRDALRLVHGGLQRGEYCMAGYRLARVASRHGPVSRGVCSVDGDGWLRGVTEHTSISASAEQGPAGEDSGASGADSGASGAKKAPDGGDPGRFVSVAPDGSTTSLPGDALISMNLWGLLPEVLPSAKELFNEFIARRRDSPDAEFYLPTAVDSLIGSGEIRVRVLPTDATPVGITYRADTAEVRARIADEVEHGVYPDPLWSRRPESIEQVDPVLSRRPERGTHASIHASPRTSTHAHIQEGWRGRGMPDLFDLDATVHAALFQGAAYPWDVLAGLEKAIAALVSSMPEPRIRSAVPAGVTIEGDVYIGPGCRIEPGAYIRGPAWIGEGCEVRQGAYLRGSVLAGAGAVLGHASEFKNCVLLEGAQAPHFNYVGDSVLGIGAHAGAGVILSNFRLDHGLVVVRPGRPESGGGIPSGLRKFGALLGDRCEIGCNSVLNPGTVLGRGSAVLPLSRVRGMWPAGTRLP